MFQKNRRTDLALESHELIREQTVRTDPQAFVEPPGVEMETAGTDEIKITRIKVKSPAGEASVGKPMGNYITLEVSKLRDNDQDLYEETCKALAAELVNILKLGPKSAILVVGLGNWNVTPDALGPKVVSNLMVFGIYSADFSSSDYYPLIPWLGVFLYGAAIGKFCYMDKRQSIFKFTFKDNIISKLGRHTLIIYLVHQPAIIGVLSLIDRIKR
jgi:hypothetical protein